MKPFAIRMFTHTATPSWGIESRYGTTSKEERPSPLPAEALSERLTPAESQQGPDMFLEFFPVFVWAFCLGAGRCNLPCFGGSFCAGAVVSPASFSTSSASPAGLGLGWVIVGARVAWE